SIAWQLHDLWSVRWQQLQLGDAFGHSAAVGGERVGHERNLEGEHSGPDGGELASDPVAEHAVDGIEALPERLLLPLFPCAASSTIPWVLLEPHRRPFLGANPDLKILAAVLEG